MVAVDEDAESALPVRQARAGRRSMAADSVGGRRRLASGRRRRPRRYGGPRGSRLGDRALGVRRGAASLREDGPLCATNWPTTVRGRILKGKPTAAGTTLRPRCRDRGRGRAGGGAALLQGRPA
jgi:hypothetical protein